MPSSDERIRIYEYENVESISDLPVGLPKKIGQCISRSFGGTITEDDAERHMLGDQILVAQIEGRTIGFSSTSITSPAVEFNIETPESKAGGYFAGAAIDESCQGEGIYHVLNRRRLEFVFNKDVEYIFTRTQNPRVQETISKDLKQYTYDNGLKLNGTRRTLMIGAYGAMLTHKRPFSRNLGYDDINYERGDAALITWLIDR